MVTEIFPQHPTVYIVNINIMFGWGWMTHPYRSHCGPVPTAEWGTKRESVRRAAHSGTPSPCCRMLGSSGLQGRRTKLDGALNSMDKSCKQKQECIPVVCVLSAAVSRPSRGRGVSALLGVHLPPLWTESQTGVKTLPFHNFACGR